MKPSVIFERLEIMIGPAGKPRELQAAIEHELLTYFNLPAIQAAENAEQLEDRVRRLILTSKEQCDRRGTFPTITISSTSKRIVLGSCVFEAGDSEAIKSAKLARRYKPELLQAIRTLTFGDFEKFGAKILRELGASKVRVTPHADDQGIDFYGILSLGELVQSPPAICQLAHDITLRFAGQAKHYPVRAIGPDTVRELIGSIDLARYQVLTRELDLFEELELRPFHPLMAMLFTTGRFTSGALELGEKTGVILRSGEQLAVFLADRGIGILQTADGAHYDEPSFRTWLESEI